MPSVYVFVNYCIPVSTERLNKGMVKGRSFGIRNYFNGINCAFFKNLRYGIFERCKELVEAGYDVRQPDKENVSLLHWAAINNRLDLVR